MALLPHAGRCGTLRKKGSVESTTSFVHPSVSQVQFSSVQASVRLSVVYVVTELNRVSRIPLVSM